VEELRAGGAPKGAGGILLLMTPEQRELFKKMQSMMSLLEGHASFVMNEVGRGQIHDLDRLRRSLKERRRSEAWRRPPTRDRVRRDPSVRHRRGSSGRQVERVGMDGFNLVCVRRRTFPRSRSLRGWIARVAGG
jgi:uncharacterized protein (DUF2342 family)